jgi:DNA-binding transcriptional LysR family regulator
MSMNTGHLRLIVTVAESGSITRAAQVLGLTQSGVSKQLRHIESTLGVPLFTRRRTGCRPTDLGHGILAQAKSTLAGLNNIDHWIATVRTPSRPRLGGHPGTLKSELARWMSGTTWGAQLSVWDELDPEISLDMLGRGQLDLAVLYENDGAVAAPLPGDVRAVVIHPVEPVFVIAGPNVHLPRTGALSLADIAEHPWADEPPGLTPWSDYVRHVCQHEGVTLTQTYYSVFPATILAVVARGLALAPVTAGYPCAPQVGKVRELAGAPLTQSIRLAYHTTSVVANHVEEICWRLASCYTRVQGRSAAFNTWWNERGRQQLASF